MVMGGLFILVAGWFGREMAGKLTTTNLLPSRNVSRMSGSPRCGAVSLGSVRSSPGCGTSGEGERDEAPSVSCIALVVNIAIATYVAALFVREPSVGSRETFGWFSNWELATTVFLYLCGPVFCRLRHRRSQRTCDRARHAWPNTRRAINTKT
jgi:hypothetical protein